MSIAIPRRVGVAGLLGLLAGTIVLMLAPGNPGAIRLAGVGLLWWYAAAAAPLAAVVLMLVVRHASSQTDSSGAGWASAAAWTSPVVLALVAARVFTGEPDAPAIALAVLLAPLIARLHPAAVSEPPSNLLATLALAVGIGLVLWANCLLLADVAALAGLPRWATSFVAAAAALLAVTSLRGDDVAGAQIRQRPGATPTRLAGAGLALLYGAAGLAFVALVAIVAATLATSPWAAWRSAASRPALTFGERDPWVTEGRTLAAPLALEFTEIHHVTALSPALYRVYEPGRFREWQLRAGESLTLRAGDRLVIEAGARLRFEAGRRVPGAFGSGVTWADPPERGAPSTVVHALGAALTLVGGAVALLGPERVPAIRGGYALPLAIVLGAICLGVYGAYSAPGLSIGMSPLAAVFDVPEAVVPGTAGRILVTASAVVLLVMFSATALALRGVLARAWKLATTSSGTNHPSRPMADPAMVLLIVAAAVAALWPGDSSGALMAGLGLTASAVVAPRLGGDGPEARLAGSLVGATVLAGLVVLRLPAWAGVVGTYPALAAAPLAWIVARAESARRARRAAR
jgi:hypothetical protein